MDSWRVKNDEFHMGEGLQGYASHVGWTSHFLSLCSLHPGSIFRVLNNPCISDIHWSVNMQNSLTLKNMSLAKQDRLELQCSLEAEGRATRGNTSPPEVSGKSLPANCCSGRRKLLTKSTNAQARKQINYFSTTSKTHISSMINHWVEGNLWTPGLF